MDAVKPRIALVTCKRLREPDHDARPMRRAFRALGVEPVFAAWDDPSMDWGAFDLAVIRSTWNYIHHLPAFLAWAKGAARSTRLMNPYSFIRWNSDKRYLARLAREGVRVVPTVYVSKGRGGNIPRGWDDVVIKPRVGSGSFLTRRFGDRKKAEAFLRKAAASRDMMIQPYVRSVETRGERSFVWIGGAITHVIRKSPRLHGHAESVTANHRIESDERRFALKVLAPYRRALLYARVDAARDDRGRLMLMELELIEPSLFLRENPAACRRFARACARSARGVKRLEAAQRVDKRRRRRR